MPNESCWMAMTDLEQSVTVVNRETEDIYFGNVCVGAGGGLTPGFWSNKNGQKTFETTIGTTTALEALVDVNLRNYNKKTGTLVAFDPTNYADFKAWLLAVTRSTCAISCLLTWRP